jgi:hypothetical protein
MDKDSIVSRQIPIERLVHNPQIRTADAGITEREEWT